MNILRVIRWAIVLFLMLYDGVEKPCDVHGIWRECYDYRFRDIPIAHYISDAKIHRPVYLLTKLASLHIHINIHFNNVFHWDFLHLAWKRIRRPWNKLFSCLYRLHSFFHKEQMYWHICKQSINNFEVSQQLYESLNQCMLN